MGTKYSFKVGYADAVRDAITPKTVLSISGNSLETSEDLTADELAAVQDIYRGVLVKEA